MKRKLVPIWFILLFVFLAGNKIYSQDIPFLGRYVIERNDAFRFIQQGDAVGLPISVHVSILDEYGQEGLDYIDDACYEWTIEVMSFIFPFKAASINQDPLILDFSDHEPYPPTGDGIFATDGSVIGLDLQDQVGFPNEFKLGDAIAITVNYYWSDDCSSEFDPILIEGDIALNPYAPILAVNTSYTSENDFFTLKDIAMHSIGHVLGLRHDNDYDWGVGGMAIPIWSNHPHGELSFSEVESIRQLYHGEYGPYTPENLCENFDVSTLEDCIGDNPPPPPPPPPCCNPCCDDSKSVSSKAISNMIIYYYSIENKKNIDDLLFEYINNIDVIESSIDEHVYYRGETNKGGVKISAVEEPTNRVGLNNTGETTQYSQYQDFNSVLQKVFDEFIPILNHEFDCDCESDYHFTDFQINLLINLIDEMKNLPITENFIVELNNVKAYLQSREDTDIKTEILNYSNY